MLASVMPISEHSVLCVLRDIDPTSKRELQSAYAAFLYQFLQSIDNIFDEVLRE